MYPPDVSESKMFGGYLSYRFTGTTREYNLIVRREDLDLANRLLNQILAKAQDN